MSASLDPLLFYVERWQSLYDTASADRDTLRRALRRLREKRLAMRKAGAPADKLARLTGRIDRTARAARRAIERAVQIEGYLRVARLELECATLRAALEQQTALTQRATEVAQRAVAVIDRHRVPSGELPALTTTTPASA